MTACQNHLVAPARSSTHQLCIERLWRTLTHSAQLEGLIVGQRTRRVRYWLDKPFHRTAGLVELGESRMNAARRKGRAYCYCQAVPGFHRQIGYGSAAL